LQDSRINMPASCKSNNTVSASQAYCARATGLFRVDSLNVLGTTVSVPEFLLHLTQNHLIATAHRRNQTLQQKVVWTSAKSIEPTYRPSHPALLWSPELRESNCIISGLDTTRPLIRNFDRAEVSPLAFVASRNNFNRNSQHALSRLGEVSTKDCLFIQCIKNISVGLATDRLIQPSRLRKQR
jgi:hypothetical protein